VQDEGETLEAQYLYHHQQTQRFVSLNPEELSQPILKKGVREVAVRVCGLLITTHLPKPIQDSSPPQAPKVPWVRAAPSSGQAR